MTTDSVGIVGAGMAGLACALQLTSKGIPCAIFEASDAPGGRIRTDFHEGFRLDRGFQVLQTAYPEARAVLDYPALKLRSFNPGALVYSQGDWKLMADPWRKPSTAWASLNSDFANFADFWKLYRLRQRLLSTSIEQIWDEPELPTIDYLQKSIGFSRPLIEAFFRPWYSGIFLEADLQTTSRFFNFVFKMLAEGEAAIPALGMQQIPEQLANKLPQGTIHYLSPVEKIDGQTLVFANGRKESFPTIVLATDGLSATRLSEGLIPATKTCSTACLYFSCETPHVNYRWLMLNGDGHGPINNLCFPAGVSSDYAPAGKTLISASVIGAAAQGDPEKLQSDVRQQIESWFRVKSKSHPQVIPWSGSPFPRLEHLRTYRIEHALPAQPVGKLSGSRLKHDFRPAMLRPGLYSAGDYLETASIQGALASGRRVAEAIANR